MTVLAGSTRPPLAAWLRITAVPLAALIVLAGLWAAGGVLTNDFRASMALTALWFLVVAAVSGIVWVRIPGLRAAAVAAIATFVLVGGYLGYASTTDKTVNEVVATGPALLAGSSRAARTRRVAAPASSRGPGAASSPSPASPPTPAPTSSSTPSRRAHPVTASTAAPGSGS